MKRIAPRSLRWGVAVLAGGMALGTSSMASADSIGPITFEPPDYVVGTINGQQGWSKTGGYDAAVAPVATFPWASRYRFGTQALRISNAVTSGAFGDQTFSPGLASPAGEESGKTRFEASFRIGTTMPKHHQQDLFLSVSPDDGNGSRMTYLSFTDKPEGIVVTFYDVTNTGPYPKQATFNGTEIATLSRRRAHTIKFVVDLKPGPANDRVRIYIDRRLKMTGTTWEDYYRYDPEQTGNGNVVPTIGKLLFRASGPAVMANDGQGYLIDRVSLRSSNPPFRKGHCWRHRWTSHTHANGAQFHNRRACMRYVRKHAHKHGRHHHRHDRGQHHQRGDRHHHHRSPR